jgi:hypothetical protein
MHPTERIICNLSPIKNGGIGISKQFQPIFKMTENLNYALLTPDKKHLQFIYDRMHYHHHNHASYSYMLKFYEIINQAPQREITKADAFWLELQIYSRMQSSGEKENYDYMLKFHEILDSKK